MAEGPSRTLFTGEQVLDLIDSDIEDFDDGMDEVFFPGSDDELGFAEEEIEDGRRLVNNNSDYHIDQVSYICVHCSDDDGSGDEHGDDSSSGYGII